MQRPDQAAIHWQMTEDLAEWQALCSPAEVVDWKSKVWLLQPLISSLWTIPGRIFHSCAHFGKIWTNQTLERFFVCSFAHSAPSDWNVFSLVPPNEVIWLFKSPFKYFLPSSRVFLVTSRQKVPPWWVGSEEFRMEVGGGRERGH